MEVSTLDLSSVPRCYGIRQAPLNYTLLSAGTCRSLPVSAGTLPSTTTTQPSSHRLVIATSEGVVIFHDRQAGTTHRVPPVGYAEVTCVRAGSELTVWGTDTGHVATYDQQGCQGQSRLHGCRVTSVCCHGNRIVSSDSSGTVVVADVSKGRFVQSCGDGYKGSDIVSVQCISATLFLVNTLQRALLLTHDAFTLATVQVGSKDRKRGKFGACILDAHTVLVSRPGLRLWYAHISGQVLKTIQLKPILLACKLPPTSGDEDSWLGDALPKSPVVSRLARLGDKLVALQIGSVLLVLETVNLSITGWMICSDLLDWTAVPPRQLLLLSRDNHVTSLTCAPVEEAAAVAEEQDGSVRGSSPGAGSVQSEPAGERGRSGSTAREAVVSGDSGTIQRNDPSGMNGDLESSVSLPESIDQGRPVSDAAIKELSTEVSSTTGETQKSPSPVPDTVSSPVPDTVFSTVPDTVSSPDSGIVSSPVSHEISSSPISELETPVNRVVNGLELAKSPPLNGLGSAVSSDITAPMSDGTTPVSDIITPIGDAITPVSDVITTISDGTTPIGDLITTASEGTPTELLAPSLENSTEDIQEMMPLVRSPPRSPEKRAVDELRENIGRKLTSLAFPTPSTGAKQLIRSETNLPVYEPDKISISSQETTNSSCSASTTFEEDEDKIAVRIRKKKSRPRPSSRQSPVAEGKLLEVNNRSLQAETTGNTPDINISPPPSVEPSTNGLVDASDVTAHLGDVMPSLNESDVSFDGDKILNVLSTLGEGPGILLLDDLGIPRVQRYQQDEFSVTDDSLQTLKSLDDNATLSLPSTVDEESPSDYEEGERDDTTRVEEQEEEEEEPEGEEEEEEAEEGGVRRRVRLDNSDLYSMDTDDQASSVEIGEDPLSLGQFSTAAAISSARKSRDITTKGEEKEVVTCTDHFISDDTWVTVKGPNLTKIPVTVVCLAVSNVSVWCTDTWGILYFSPNKRGQSLHWTKVPGAKLSSISVSDCGQIVWGVSTSHRAMVRLGIDSSHPTGTDWSELMLDSQSVAVDSSGVWLLMSSGDKLLHRSGVTQGEPQGEKWQTVPLKSIKLSRISVSNSVLWAVRDNGQLVIRQGISRDKPTGDSWHLMRVNNVRECHVGRSLELGWVVDTAGIVYFQCGVTRSKPHGSNLWWHVSASEQVSATPAAAASLAGWFGARRRSDTKQVTTSSEGGVWLLCGDSTLCRRYGNITGHNWASVLRSTGGPTANRFRWTGLVAQGAYPDKTAPVWAINGDGEVLCLTRSCEPRILETPEVTVCVGATLGVLWVLDSLGRVLVRHGISEDNLMGDQWKVLNLMQFAQTSPPVHLAHLSVSECSVWGVDRRGTVWYRGGTLAGSDGRVVQAWIQVESGGLVFKQVQVGKGHMVWALDCKGAVFVRVGVTPSLPVGEAWELVPGSLCRQLSVSANQVYGVTSNSTLVCRYGISPSLPAGNYWRRLAGPSGPDRSVRILSTTLNNCLWCEGGNGELYRRRVKVVAVQTRHTNCEQQTYEGWEVL